MNQNEAQILRDILHRTASRYMTIRPAGIDLGNGRKLLPCFACRILDYGAARTLYRGRRPECRSLNAVTALRKPRKNCHECFDRKHCTGQVRLDLVFESHPYRLLLAFTSAKNFLLYTGDLVGRKLELQKITTNIQVINRGSWGELRFRVGPS